MAQMFFNEDVSVLSYGVTTGLLTSLASGSLKGTRDRVDGTEALKDSAKEHKRGRYEFTFTGKARTVAGETPWWAGLTGEEIFTFTYDSGAHGLAGVFTLDDVSLSLDGALAWDLTMTSSGLVEIDGVPLT